MGYEQTKSDFKRYKQFFSEDEEKVIHIIETGFSTEEKRFIVVHEDAYGLELGKSEKKIKILQKAIKLGYKNRIIKTKIQVLNKPKK